MDPVWRRLISRASRGPIRSVDLVVPGGAAILNARSDEDSAFTHLFTNPVRRLDGDSLRPETT